MTGTTKKPSRKKRSAKKSETGGLNLKDHILVQTNWFSLTRSEQLQSGWYLGFIIRVLYRVGYVFSFLYLVLLTLIIILAYQEYQFRAADAVSFVIAFGIVFGPIILRRILLRLPRLSMKRRITIKDDWTILVEFENKQVYTNHLWKSGEHAWLVHRKDFYSWYRVEPIFYNNDSFGQLFRNCYIPKRVLNEEQMAILQSYKR